MIITEKLARSIVMGSAMGDGHINHPAKHVKNGNIGIGFTQNSKTEIPYIEMKHRLLSEFYTTNPIRFKHNNTVTFDISMRDTSGISEYIRTNTRYSDGSRRFPPIEEFDEVALLFWYLDDGSLSIVEQKRPNRRSSMCRLLSIHLQSYKDEDILNFMDLLNSKFGLDFKPKRHKDKIVSIVIRKLLGIHKFLSLINPYMYLIPECMRYKLCLSYSKTPLSKFDFLVSDNICDFDKTGYCKCRNKDYRHLIDLKLLNVSESSTTIPSGSTAS